MTWRELWKSTVSNLRVLLGFSPPPQPGAGRKVAPPRATLKPPSIHKPALHENREESTPPRGLATQKPMAQTRKLPPVTGPALPVDLALDAAAFALLPARPGATPEANPQIPIGRNPESHTKTVPETSGGAKVDTNLETTLGTTWTRQGIAHVEELAHESKFSPFDGGDEPPQDDGGRFGGGDDDGYDPSGNDPIGDESEGDADDDEGIALTTLLESLLFVAPEPVEPRQLAQTLAQPLDVIELGLAELADYYQRSLRGLRLQRFNNKVQLVTTPVAAPFIESFLNLDTSTRLSSPALETLAVIAYRQPVTRAQIEAVRGVDCAGVLRSLVQRGLVAEVGRMEGVGRPILYGVTELFMQHFGLVEMGELPPLEEAEADRLWAATILDEQEANPPQA